MKAELEQIKLDAEKQSFIYFDVERKSFVPYWHFHPELELTYIEKGEGTRYIGDSIERFNDGDLVLIGRNIPHHWVSTQQNTDQLNKAKVWQFNASIFDSFKELGPISKLLETSKRGIHFIDPNDELLSIITQFKNQQEPLPQFILFIQLLQQLSRHQKKEVIISAEYRNELYKKSKLNKYGLIHNYILANLTEKITIKDAAQKVHMVPQSFCRWFRKNSGYSFISFLNKSRVENACHLLLQDHSKSIKQIAFKTGFESISHFNRTFKKWKGITPRAYRLSHNP